MDKINELISDARAKGCSDIHLTADLPPIYRRLGQLEPSSFALTCSEMNEMITSLMTKEQIALLEQGEDIDFCYATANGLRQRVNVYRQKNELCVAIRLLNDQIPTLDQLFLPPVIRQLADQPRGLILVTGPTGSGKSTTLAAMIDHINQTRQCHIVTIEDPIEYMHQHKNSLVHQREVGVDTVSFASALRSSLREDPDVILVGEMRDYETISAALTAAETGHLVLSTLHTTGAANTIDRIIDVFPPHSQNQVRTQLAGVLKGIITQQLVPLADQSNRTAAFEILIGTDAVLNLIRENKCHQLGSMMQTGARDGMQTLNSCLAALVRTQRITAQTAYGVATDVGELKQYIG